MRVALLVAVLVVAANANVGSMLHETLTQAFHKAAARTGPGASGRQAFVPLLQSLHELLTPHAAAAHNTFRCNASDPSKHCDTVPDLYFRFIPPYVGSVPSNGQTLEWFSPCFKSNVAHLGSFLGAPVVHVTSSQPAYHGCIDHYLFATAEAFATHQIIAGPQETVKFTVSITFAHTNKDYRTWFEREGVRVFRFMDSEKEFAPSLKATVALLVDAEHPTVTEEHAAPFFQFLKDYVGLTYPARTQIVTEVPFHLIGDGTLLAIMRPDGLGAVQIWACGQTTSHIAMAVRLDDVLYIVESTDKTPYWKTPHIQITPIQEWIPLAVAANYSVALLPLADKYQALFSKNLAQASTYIRSMLGMPYGYHNFLFGFVDTISQNLPFPMSHQFWEIVILQLSKYDGKLAEKMWNQALRFRLNGNWSGDSNTVELANQAAQKGMSLMELWTVPEQDKYVYSDGPSMVCDVFACEIYKSAGFFGDLDVQCTEFQNIDVYRLAFFNVNGTRPSQCEAADPNLPYCMLLGYYQLPLPHVSTLEPYAHMSERCPSVPPLYARTPTC